MGPIDENGLQRTEAGTRYALAVPLWVVIAVFVWAVSSASAPLAIQEAPDSPFCSFPITARASRVDSSTMLANEVPTSTRRRSSRPPRRPGTRPRCCS